MVTISSCKKYPDGPLIATRTKQQRMTGDWVVLNYKVDGADSTSHLQSQPYYGIYQIQEKYDGENPWIVVNHNSSFLIDGRWVFRNNRNLIRFTSNKAKNVDSPYANYETTWEIRKLTREELWLKTTYNGKEHFMKMKKIRDRRDF